MFGKLKDEVYRLISSHRDAPLVRAAYRASQFIDRAYHNEGNDLETNGERRTLDHLATFDFTVALDVGANAGNWSRLAASTWKTCTIHAFEIAPDTARKFRAAMTAFDHGDRIDLHEFGLSDVSGAVPMYFFPDHDDLTCSHPRHAAYASTQFEGQVSTLDAFCRERGIDHIDYLKIDVEGDELKVLRGASDLLQRNGLSCIQFEYGAFSIDTRIMIKDYYEMLGGRYDIGKIYPGYVDFSDYAWQAENYRFCNYLCVLKERTEIRRRLGR